MIRRVAAVVVVLVLAASGSTADASKVAPGQRVTVPELESPPFSTCMAAAGQPSVPAPGTAERRAWSASRQQSYRDALWGCFYQVHPDAR